MSDYSYGEFNRLAEISHRAGSFNQDISYEYYSYSNKSIGLITGYTSTVNGTATTYNYTYDSKGNITQIDASNDSTVVYTYDDLGQLISEVKGDVTRTYTYDNAGNIVSIEETKPKTIPPIPDFEDNTHWAFNPTETTTNTLGYSNSQWGDLLTSYNGTAITYDGIGNPLSYYNGTSYTFTWEGRRLVGAVKGSKTMSFAYNDDGIRTSKTVNGVTTTYYVNGGQIVAESNNSKTIVYIYDASGAPIGMMYRTPSYAENAWDVFWYEKNLQGDIVAVYNSSGTKLVTYDYYDAWGNYIVSYSNGGASTGVIYNPFRYRGYYYDTDLGMYYLQSRYYDAKICRFISADSYTSTGQGILSTNMFAYCGNNPVMGYDPTGHWDWGGFAVGVALVIGSCVALYYGSWQAEPTLSATLAVMTTGVVMMYAAATDSVMVIDLSGTLQANRPIYGKAGGTLLIDFSEDEMFLYGHAGFGIGYSNAITYSVGLVRNYENPEDYSKHFIGGSVGGVMGVNHCWSPDYEYCDAPKATSLTFSKDLGIGSMIGISIGAEYDYYSSPIPIFSWGGD